MAKVPFNWSLLDRSGLYSLMFPLGKSIVGKEVAVSDVQKILSNGIKKVLPIKIKLERDPKQIKGLIYIGGAYYSDLDKNGKTPIEIIFSYKDTNSTLKITSYRWKRMCALFADTVLHEIIHMKQYRSRKFKTIEGYLSTASKYKDRVDQSYYGHRDEIGAYSFNIACELIDRFGDDFTAIKTYLESDQSKRRKYCSYHRYLKTFDWNQNHKIIKSLKSKVIKNIPYARLGKPFRTNDYLTY